MNPFVNLYIGNPTAGKTNGELVSFNNLLEAALVFSLDAAKEEFQVFKCAIRMEEGWNAKNVTLTYTEPSWARVRMSKAPPKADAGSFKDPNGKAAVFVNGVMKGQLNDGIFTIGATLGENYVGSDAMKLTFDSIGTKNQIFYIASYAASVDPATVELNTKIRFDGKIGAVPL